MCLVNKLKARHAYHPAEVGQYSSRTDPKGAAWMHSMFIYPMGMAEGGLYTFHPHSDQNKTSRFAVIQFERDKELKAGSLSENA